MSETAAAGQHRWRFYRAGGVDQVVFRSGADVANLATLDQKLWMALSCPVRGLELDEKTLAFMDADKDDRIRAGEVLVAIAFLKEALRDLDLLLQPGDALPLAALNDATPTGKALLACARRVLEDLGKRDAKEIALGDVTDTERIFAQTRFNGDGVVPVEAAEDEPTRRALEDIIAAHGGATDRGGKPGVSQAKLDAFFVEARALVDWDAKLAADPALRPLGEATGAAAKAVAALKPKAEDFFARCRLAAFDPRAAAALNGADADLVALAAKPLTTDAPDVARLPLARVAAGAALPLDGGVNPAWARAVAELAAAAAPLLPPKRDRLTEAEWTALDTKLAPHAAWLASKPATAVEKLPIARLRELVAGDAKARIEALIARDKALEPEVKEIATLEKLLRYRRDMLRLLENFVSFSHFYGRRGATFQAGTLYMDGRSCDLCIRVEDAGKHAALAGLAKTYLAYCDCVQPAGGKKITIAAAFTDGDSENLMVGRNGIFYDRRGGEWDATITKVIENPISLRQAFWAPYNRFVRMVEEQVAKRAAAADAASTDRLAAAATATANADATAPASAAAPAGGAKPGIDVGTVAALGVALGALGTFIATIFAKFLDLGAWLPVGLVGLIFLISGPSMLLAWLKLRQRNLGPILDASNWAVNGRVRINVPFGAALTTVARLPPGAERTLDDPYAEKKRPWGLYVAALVIAGLAIAYGVGGLDRFLRQEWRSARFLPWSAEPAATTPTATPAAPATPGGH